MRFSEKLELMAAVKRLHWGGASGERILQAVQEALGVEPEKEPAPLPTVSRLDRARARREADREKFLGLRETIEGLNNPGGGAA